jgi:hypothetical protein
MVGKMPFGNVIIKMLNNYRQTGTKPDGKSLGD